MSYISQFMASTSRTAITATASLDIQLPAAVDNILISGCASGGHAGEPSSALSGGSMAIAGGMALCLGSAGSGNITSHLINPVLKVVAISGNGGLTGSGYSYEGYTVDATDDGTIITSGYNSTLAAYSFDWGTAWSTLSSGYNLSRSRAVLSRDGSRRALFIAHNSEKVGYVDGLPGSWSDDVTTLVGKVVQDARWLKDRFIVLCAGGYIAHGASAKPGNWTLVQPIPGDTATKWQDVAWDGTTYVLVGTNGAGVSKVVTSTDLVTFTDVTTAAAPGAANLYEVETVGAGKFIIAGDASAVKYSTDSGATWAASSGLAAGKTHYQDCIVKNPSTARILLANSSGAAGSGLYYSDDDGATWTAVPAVSYSHASIAPPPRSNMIGVCGRLFVHRDSTYLRVSADGVTWTTLNTTSTSDGADVAIYDVDNGAELFRLKGGKQPSSDTGGKGGSSHGMGGVGGTNSVSPTGDGGNGGYGANSDGRTGDGGSSTTGCSGGAAARSIDSFPGGVPFKLPGAGGGGGVGGVSGSGGGAGSAFGRPGNGTTSSGLAGAGYGGGCGGFPGDGYRGAGGSGEAAWKLPLKLPRPGMRLRVEVFPRPNYSAQATNPRAGKPGFLTIEYGG